MKKILLFALFLVMYRANAQDTINIKSLYKEFSDHACQCIDSINTVNMTSEQLNLKIDNCIKENVSPVLVGISLNNSIKRGIKKNTEININLDENSKDFRETYNVLLNNLISNCKALKIVAAARDIHKENSFSKNTLAMAFYHAGEKDFEKENWDSAIKNYKLAVEKDPNFVFAWDNLGLAYRKKGDYKNAIYAYEQSLKLDPNGLMPLQNIAVAYKYDDQYEKAIESYEKIGKVNPNDPEIDFGIGTIYFEKLKNYEKALDYMAKAYVKYIDIKSPYKSDAQAVISAIYKEMKAKGNEEKFKNILKENGIDFK